MTEPVKLKKVKVDRLRVPVESLRWRCPEDAFSFETTADVEPIRGVVGQDTAVDALRFGLEVHAPGQNIYVRGLSGTGRLALVRHLMEEIRPTCPQSPDLAYVHNFSDPDRPRLISVPRGQGARFSARMGELAEYVQTALLPALRSDALRERRVALDKALESELSAIGGPFDEELKNNDLGLATIKNGDSVQPVILPLIDGEPAPPERLQELIQKGDLDEAAMTALREKISQFSERFGAIQVTLQELREKHRTQVRELFEAEARRLIGKEVADIIATFPGTAVQAFLAEIVDDVTRRRLSGAEGNEEAINRLYAVNLVLGQDGNSRCPIVIESTPTLHNLLGAIDRKALPDGTVYSDHMMITAGSLLRANGGYLVLEARDVLTEPGSWKVLMRTLRTGRLEIVPHDSALFGMRSSLKPEPIELSVKVIILGDPGLYRTLDAGDPDFAQQFKVLADFESSVPNDAAGLQYYAGVLARHAANEGMLPFDRSAVACLSEYGARIAGRNDRLTTRLGRLADIAREGSFVARQAGADVVTREHIGQSIRRGRGRANLPARKFREHVRDGVLHIETQGRVAGQVNGLAVVHSGPLTYGFPARITATTGPGHKGTVNIEGEARLSGSIHTKGFFIIQGLLRHLFPTDYPLTFSASIAFEQSYGGIDGDSASGAESCCLISSLSGVPLRQDRAMTGAIDQFGHIQAIGGATEKVEGFFDTCAEFGLTGKQGVIIPKSNVRDLMLRQEVVDACREGKFHLWAVDTIHEALEVFTGSTAGVLDEDDDYAEDTVLWRAMDRIEDLWLMASGQWDDDEDDDDDEDAAPEA